MEICNKEKCTGCYTCIAVCKHGCITMQEDEFGALHPIVDEKKCVQCNLCKKSCPNNIKQIFQYPIKCYASWITDNEKRKICASGGIGTIMSEYVIKNGGVIFGSRYNECLVPIMTYTDKLDELEYFKGSRYVQSIVGNDTYKQVKEFLLTNRQVLFIGTPCQIAGLKGFLRKDYVNLITVDLICHGVCPTKYFTEEVDYLTKKYNLKDVADVRFRGNDGNNFRLTLWNKDRRKLFPRDNYREKLFHISGILQYYIAGFLLGVSMRENCYTCNYARPERISDITIGDFIGLGKHEPFDYPKANVSSVTLNSDKGSHFYALLSAWNGCLINIERRYEERLEYKPSLVHPYPRHILNTTFKDEYEKNGYVVGIRKTLRGILIKKQVKYYVDHWTYLYRIPRKIIKIIMNKKSILR